MWVDTLVVHMDTRALRRIAHTLMAHGRPASTPAAVIRWGTTDRQLTVAGRLDDIAARAETARLEPPAVVVIGDVVGPRPPLAGSGRPEIARRASPPRVAQSMNRMSDPRVGYAKRTFLRSLAEMPRRMAG